MGNEKTPVRFKSSTIMDEPYLDVVTTDTDEVVVVIEEYGAIVELRFTDIAAFERFKEKVASIDLTQVLS